MSYVSSDERVTPTIWRHLETSARLPLPKHTRHKTIPIGSRYGRLEINSRPFKLEGYEAYIYYECLCDCGATKVVRSQRLGATVSCGCRMRESSSENGGHNKRTGPPICKKCGEEHNTNGTLCHRCLYQKHKVKANKHSRGWSNRQQASPERYLNMMLMQLKAREKRKEKLGKNYRRISITKKFVHSLWAKQEGKCALTGIHMRHCMHDPRSVSIDRTDSLGDYTEDNIQLVCMFANLGKRNFDNAVIQEMIEEIRGQA